MSLRKKQFEDFKLYGVTDLKKFDAIELAKIEKALQGGVDIVQLRSKTLSDRELLAVGHEIKKLTHHYGKLFFINDRPDICCLLEADGLHIGQDDLPVKEVRKMLPKGTLLGKSTHSFEQARDALVEDVDYIGCGPIYSTPTKPDYISVGLALIEKVMAIATKPVVCIGGINLTNIPDVLAAGANRVAVVRALFDNEDPEQAAKDFQQQLNNHYVLLS